MTENIVIQKDFSFANASSTQQLHDNQNSVKDDVSSNKFKEQSDKLE